MIYCNKDCAHQSDGICMLDTISASTEPCNLNDCLYFQASSSAEKTTDQPPHNLPH